MAGFPALRRPTGAAHLRAVLATNPRRRQAARLEVDWWRVHREIQRGPGPADPAAVERLVAALQALYAYTYGAAPDAVRLAAQERAEAMRLSDGWVRDGADPASPVIPRERAALVRSYAALLVAVHQ